MIIHESFLCSTSYYILIKKGGDFFTAKEAKSKVVICKSLNYFISYHRLIRKGEDFTTSEAKGKVIIHDSFLCSTSYYILIKKGEDFFTAKEAKSKVVICKSLNYFTSYHRLIRKGEDFTTREAKGKVIKHESFLCSTSYILHTDKERRGLFHYKGSKR